MRFCPVLLLVAAGSAQANLWDNVAGAAAAGWQDACAAAVDVQASFAEFDILDAAEAARAAADGANAGAEKAAKKIAGALRDGANAGTENAAKKIKGAARVAGDAALAPVELLLNKTLGIGVDDLPNYQTLCNYAYFVFVLASFAVSLWLGFGIKLALLLNILVVCIGVPRTLRIIWAVLRVGVPFAAKHPGPFVAVIALCALVGQKVLWPLLLAVLGELLGRLCAALCTKPQKTVTGALLAGALVRDVRVLVEAQKSQMAMLETRLRTFEQEQQQADKAKRS